MSQLPTDTDPSSPKATKAVGASPGMVPAAATAGPGAAAFALAIFLTLSFGAAAIGSQFPPGAWYASLNKPSWNPPNWIFGPVWSALYTMMAVSAWLVWRRLGLKGGRVPLAVFGLQLVLNATWSWVFFGLRQPALGFGEILLLWIAIAATVLQFRRHHALAAWLLVPYLAWVTFAAVLNLVLWRLNPGATP